MIMHVPMNAENAGGEFLTYSEVAELYHVPIATIGLWARGELLETIHTPEGTRIPQSALEVFEKETGTARDAK